MQAQQLVHTEQRVYRERTTEVDQYASDVENEDT